MSTAAAKSKPATVDEYLKALSPERLEIMQALRKVINENLRGGLAEGLQYNGIGYFIPHSLYPAGYHCDPKQPLPYGGIASGKQYVSIGFMCSYMKPELGEWFRKAWTATGRKLDMGAACIRVKKMDDIAFDVIAELVRKVPGDEYIKIYESIRAQSASGRAAAKKAAANGSTSNKPAAKPKASASAKAKGGTKKVVKKKAKAR
ncbi:MAG: DUF1801 domain-containing protein [Phycisphaerales bacterium]|nr:DUF1801 domain-containing protein [Phycisphaerales bacterium]